MGATLDDELLSAAEFEGGVSRFPTLTAAVVGREGPVRGGYLCCGIGLNCARCVGGGSSKLGRFEAACRRWVRLAGGPFSASRDVPIGATMTEASVTFDLGG